MFQMNHRDAYFQNSQKIIVEIAYTVNVHV